MRAADEPLPALRPFGLAQGRLRPQSYAFSHARTGRPPLREDSRYHDEITSALSGAPVEALEGRSAVPRRACPERSRRARDSIEARPAFRLRPQACFSTRWRGAASAQGGGCPQTGGRKARIVAAP